MSGNRGSATRLPAEPIGPLAGDPDGLLLSREVAAIFAVNPRAIGNSATSGRLAPTRTAHGQLRLRRRDVLALYQG